MLPVGNESAPFLDSGYTWSSTNVLWLLQDPGTIWCYNLTVQKWRLVNPINASTMVYPNPGDPVSFIYFIFCSIMHICRNLHQFFQQILLLHLIWILAVGEVWYFNMTSECWRYIKTGYANASYAGAPESPYFHP